MGKSLGQICEQIKDRKRNGDKSLEQVVEHMAQDELVGWGWHPGLGRTAVPGTQKEFGALIDAWADYGAHCPKPCASVGKTWDLTRLRGSGERGRAAASIT